MGLCHSNAMSPEDQAEKARSKNMDRQLQEQLHADLQIKKLLLLGAGESGKSTLFKQLDNIYGEGFTEEETLAYISIIHSNIVDAIKKLLHMSDEFAEGMTIACETEAGIVGDLMGDESLEDEPGKEIQLGQAIDTLWRDPAIQTTYGNRSGYQLTDSAKYFLDEMGRIRKENWLPTKDDMLRARVRTTGIVEKKFEIEKNKFQMYDVGGQRNERKKWIHCFDSVTAVLFVGVMSEYNQVLYEDDSTNRMEETLQLFGEIVNSKFFVDTAMILFLNKRDLFQEKIEAGKDKLWDCPVFRMKRWNKAENVTGDIEARYDDAEIESMFPDINGFDGGSAAIEAKFMEQNTKNSDKLIYPHHTCATDTDNITFVFDAVREIIIKGALGDAGLV